MVQCYASFLQLFCSSTILHCAYTAIWGIGNALLALAGYKYNLLSSSLGYCDDYSISLSDALNGQQIDMFCCLSRHCVCVDQRRGSCRHWRMCHGEEVKRAADAGDHGPVAPL
jgi:hypothetical protein